MKFKLLFGQAFFGPFSDSKGRKPAIYIGFVVFSFGCLVSIFSTSFSGMQARQSYCLLCHLAQALFRSRDLLPITWILRRATRGFFLASPTRLGVSILLSILLSVHTLEQASGTRVPGLNRLQLVINLQPW
jgi:MFS family permease